MSGKICIVNMENVHCVAHFEIAHDFVNSNQEKK